MKPFIKTYPQIIFVFILLNLTSNKAYCFADIISLTASSGKYSDETIVRLENQSTYNFDTNWDAYKLFNTGYAPNLYTSLEGINYSINSIPDNVEEVFIPLNLKVAFIGEYLITVKSLKNSLDSTLIITLEDRLLNKLQELYENATYSFASVPNDTSARFVLHYKRIITTIQLPTSSTTTDDLITDIALNTAEKNIEVLTTDEGIIVNGNNTKLSYISILVITSEGEIIYNEERTCTSFSDRIKINKNSKSVYIVRIINNKEVINRKVIF